MSRSRLARAVVPAAKASKSTKAPAKKPAAAKAKTSNSPSAWKGLPRKARKPAMLPKSDGDAGVQAYIASMEAWQAAIAKRVDALVVKHVPGVRKAVRWHCPFYGVEGQGWFLAFAAFQHHINLANEVKTPWGRIYPGWMASGITHDEFLHLLKVLPPRAQGLFESLDVHGCSKYEKGVIHRDLASLTSRSRPQAGPTSVIRKMIGSISHRARGPQRLPSYVASPAPIPAPAPWQRGRVSPRSSSNTRALADSPSGRSAA